MDWLVVIGILVALGYLYLYMSGRYTSQDGFKDVDSNSRTVLDTSLDAVKPYMTTQHLQGDYEQDVVYQNEGGHDPTREAINNARRRFPFDWSQLPPSSSLFQSQQSLFVKDPISSASPFTKETFTNIDAEKVLPPDESKLTEDDDLKMYSPENTESLRSVDQEDVQDLIDKIYGKKGLVARVAKKANNVFEIYDTREKNPKIVYEDEVPQTQASIQSNALDAMVEPSEMLVSPTAAQEVQSGLVPWGRGETTALKRQGYNEYNPNLEGIFGPKLQWQQWG